MAVCADQYESLKSSNSRPIQTLERVIKEALQARGMTRCEAQVCLERLKAAYAGAEISDFSQSSDLNYDQNTARTGKVQKTIFKGAYLLRYSPTRATIWFCKIFPERKTDHPLSKHPDYQLCEYVECLHRYIPGYEFIGTAREGMQAWEKKSNFFNTFAEAKEELNRRVRRDRRKGQI